MMRSMDVYAICVGAVARRQYREIGDGDIGAVLHVDVHLLAVD